MFKAVIRSLFPSFVQQDVIPDYHSFERSRPIENDEPEATIAEQSKTKSSQITARPIVLNDHALLPFYDYLFGESTKSTQYDQLSEFVAGKLQQAIRNPESILQELPVMPASVTTVINILESEDFNLPDLMEIIEQEPSMAADMVKAANSSKYRRGDKDVTDLQRAFMYIGAEGLKTSVVEAYLKQYSVSSNLYFKQFGRKIWLHSANTAQIAQTLAQECVSKEEVNTIYFVALLRNLGAMVIFQLMVDAFKFVDPDAAPNSAHFKQIMSEEAVKLVNSIAKFWQLPQKIIDLLHAQITLEPAQMSAAALCVYEGNVISKSKSLLDAKRWDVDTYVESVNKELITEEAKRLAKTFLPENVK